MESLLCQVMGLLNIKGMKARALRSRSLKMGALLFLLLATLGACRGQEAAAPIVTTAPASVQAQPAASATVPSSPSALPAASASPASQVPATMVATSTVPATNTGDWPTYHRDLSRTGVAPGATSFSTARESWRSDQLDGDIYAEPLVVGGQVLVATENNSLYSLDASTGQATWSAHLGDPVPRSSLPCGDIAVTGITGTPVVDPVGSRIYAVTFVQPGQHELVVLDLATGAVQARRPVDPSGANPLVHQQRAALALSGNLVYVAYGGLFGDCGNYNGWVVASDAADASMRYQYQVPTKREGGIWAPSGPAIDASGNVYVATGNGSSVDPSAYDFSDAVLRLTPDLRLADWFAPTNWLDLNRTDTDIGSVGPALIDDGLVFQIGKAGVGYLLRTDTLGQMGGQLFNASVCNGAYGGTAYANDLIYVPCTNGLVALRLQQGPSFAKAWQASGFFAGPPIIAGGAVWTIGRDGTLYALDPTNGGVGFRTSVGQVMHFATPSAAGQQILVPTARQIIALSME